MVGGLVLSPILNVCGSPLRTLPAIGAACLVMGVLLAAAEWGASHRRELRDASLADALLIGLSQVGALIPGVSRSGATLTAALGLGFRRTDAARFSFLLGVPDILAAAKEIWELPRAHLAADGWSILAIGMLFGAASSFVAIWGLLRALERFSTWPLVIYRIVLGLGLLGAAALTSRSKVVEGTLRAHGGRRGRRERGRPRLQELVAERPARIGPWVGPLASSKRPAPGSPGVAGVRVTRDLEPVPPGLGVGGERVQVSLSDARALFVVEERRLAQGHEHRAS